MQKRILVLTGVPGVGKTTVARILAERLGGTHIDLSALALREGLTRRWDEERRTAILDLGAVRDRITAICASTAGPLIVEGHFDIVPRGLAPSVFVLRRAPWRLKEELSARGYSEDKVAENVEAELLGVCLSDALEAYGPGRVCEVDTTDRSPEEIAEEIASILTGTAACRIGRIDWLGRPEARSLLEDGRRRTSW